jgi:hypothetical protein
MSNPVPYLPTAWRKYPLSTALAGLLVIFLVLFPKGGIKIGITPITWGYLLLGLPLPILALVRLVAFPLRFRKAALLAAASVIPFDLLFLYSCRQNGIPFAGDAISDFVSFFVFPAAFLLIYPAFLPRIDGARLGRLLRFCMLTAALFGILLFVLYPLTGKLIEVPYLTVNADDYGQLESTKHIVRGPFLKLISTYNNGNVYGVATLILLPMYNVLEKKAWRRNTLKLALLLTLSRTVWAGLIFDQLLSLARLGLQSARTFPRVTLGPSLKRGIILFTTAVAIVACLTLTFGNLSFLFDENLGGRSEGLIMAFQNISFLPQMAVIAFSEIVYSSALLQYGVAGLLSIILVFAMPVLMLSVNPAILRSPMRRAALKGLILYAILIGIDGAINLIPVMVFYWFAYMIFIEGWPRELDPSAGPNGHPPIQIQNSEAIHDKLHLDAASA